MTRQDDARGSFRELWRAEAFVDRPASDGELGFMLPDQPAVNAGPAAGPRPAAAGLAFVQANLSTSEPGVLRGLHLHRHQLDHWIVIAGRAFVALVDIRPMLAGASAGPFVETRAMDEGATVTIPAGVAHGFLALERLALAYFVTNPYDGSDELGFAWDDPTAAIDWPRVEASPDGRPTTSARDASNPSLIDLIASLRR